MEYCYIGIFSSIFNWILDKILSPVFNFVAKLLSTVLSWVFNEILAPLLENVLWPLIQMTLDLIVEILAGILYGIYSSLLNIVDVLNTAFDYFSGLQDIRYQGKSMTLLEAMFEIDGLRTAFLAISAAGLCLALLLSIIAVAQSSLDMDFDNKRPVSRVLSSLFKAFIQILTVELVVYFLIRLASLLLAGVNTAVGQIGGGNGNTTIGRMIFVVSSMNACSSDKALNLNGSKSAQVGISDPVRSLFYSSDGYSYTSSDTVKRYFNLADFDYLVGFALCLFILVVLACCLVIFVQRIFDILMLFLVSPFFVGMIPLDDGEKFGRWRELFIGKCFSGFGMVITMKLYLMLCPVIMSSQIRFSTSSTELDYMTKMIFLLGGAWAVLKSGNLLTSLISSSASDSERQILTSGSAALAGVTMGGISAAGGLAVKGGAQIGEAAGKSKQKFENTRYRSHTGLGSSRPGNAKSGEGGNGPASQTVGKRKADMVSSGPLVKSFKNADGSISRAFQPGKGRLIKIGSDGKGNWNMKFMGFGIRKNAAGQINKISLPCVNLKRNAEGKMQVDRVRAPLHAATWKRNDATGKMYFRDMSPLGYRAEIDENGKYQMNSLMGLFNREKQEDGKYHFTSLGFGAVQNSRILDEDGKLRFAGIRVLGFNFHIRDDAAERNQNGSSGQNGNAGSNQTGSNS